MYNYNDQFTPSGPKAHIGAATSMRSMYVGTFTDLGRMESWVTFSRKESHTDIQPLMRPGIEPGTFRLGGRDLTTAPTPPLCANPSALFSLDAVQATCMSWAAQEQFILTLSLPRVINFKFPLRPHQKILHHTAWRVAFHSLLRWKMILLPILTISLIHFSFRRLGEGTFWTW